MANKAPKKEKCKNCFYWRGDAKQDKYEKRKLRYCCYDPPTICQTLVPSIIRDSGLVNMLEKQMKLQMKPITEHNEVCAGWRKK